MENNIEKFNYYVGCVFAILQNQFPCRVNLNFVEIVGCEKCPETISGAGRCTGLYLFNGKIQDMKSELNFVYETVKWLYETEYLIGSVETMQLGRNAFVTLSPKALEILKTIPSSVESKGNSIGQELSDAFKSAAKEQVANVAGKALSYFFRAGLGAFSGYCGL